MGIEEFAGNIKRIENKGLTSEEIIEEEMNKRRQIEGQMQKKLIIVVFLVVLISFGLSSFLLH